MHNLNDGPEKWKSVVSNYQRYVGMKRFRLPNETLTQTSHSALSALTAHAASVVDSLSRIPAGVVVS